MGAFSAHVIHKNPGIKNAGSIRGKGKMDKVGERVKRRPLKPQAINISRAKCSNYKKKINQAVN
jgi:hypothetical protein